MATPSPHQPFFNAQPFNLSQPPAYKRPPSAAGPGVYHGAQGASRSPGLQQHQGLPDQSEAIRQGKQRARDVMAAHGVDAGHASMQQYPSQVPDALNGVAMTRKRSRSGSRIPQRQPLAVQPKMLPVNDEHSRFLLSEYQQRDSWSEHLVTEAQRQTEELNNHKRHDVMRYREEVHKFKESLQGQAIIQYGEVKPVITYPASRRHPANRRTEELRVTRKLASQQADCIEELVPLRLDVELEKLRLRDTFTWNLHDRTVTPKLFADTLVEDLQIPLSDRDNISRQILREMKEQLETYYPQVYPAGVPAEQGAAYWAHKNDDMRITVRLNITVGYISLVDQFEWDINCPENSPEEFAHQMAQDLSLSGEFTTAIAHAIREQSQLYVKSLYLSNYEFDGRMIEDPDIRDNMMASPLYSVFRPHLMQKDYSPFLFELTEGDLEKTELSILREQRAQKRQLNRRGGPALPDLKDRPRTARSLVVSSVIPGAAETLEASGVLKIRRATAQRNRRRVNEDGSDDSDVDMDDSGPESPAPSAINIGTTARTRGMRGAATAAQAALKSSYGRSATPDFLLADVPKSANRRAIETHRDETTEPASLVVKLKIDATRFKTWLAKRKFGRTGAPPLSGFPTSFVPKVEKKEPATPKLPSTPNLHNKNLPKAELETPVPRSVTGTPQPDPPTELGYHDNGRVDADKTPLTTQDPPPIPAWLEKTMASLREKHPTSSFRGIMRFATLDARTQEPIRFDINSLPPGTGPPHGPVKDADGRVLADKIRFAWLPRIRCDDCPGKLYTAMRDKEDAGFEMHLKLKRHRERVLERLEREKQQKEAEAQDQDKEEGELDDEDGVNT